MQLPLLLGVFHSRLHRVKRHHRLAAEEINFDIAAILRTLDHKIDRRTRNLNRHQLTPCAEIPGRREAIAAAQVAVMRDMETKRLERRMRRKRARHIDIIIL